MLWEDLRYLKFRVDPRHQDKLSELPRSRVSKTNTLIQSEPAVPKLELWICSRPGRPTTRQDPPRNVRGRDLVRIWDSGGWFKFMSPPVRGQNQWPMTVSRVPEAQFRIAQYARLIGRTSAIFSTRLEINSGDMSEMLSRNLDNPDWVNWRTRLGCDTV